eukprot:COSAG06_NODE_262_length_18897_cov_122.542877_21_plen_32_part_01
MQLRQSGAKALAAQLLAGRGGLTASGFVQRGE